MREIGATTPLKTAEVGRVVVVGIRDCTKFCKMMLIIYQIRKIAKVIICDNNCRSML